MRYLRAIWTRLVPTFVLLTLVFSLIPDATAQTADESSLELITATRYIVIDSATGEVFTERDSTVRGGMASLTKVFTALVAIERASSLDQVIVAQESDMFDATSTTMTGFAPGIAFSVQDLLYGMMLESGNDAATALARGIAQQEGDTPEDAINRFVGWMNERVAELGLTNTNFTNPHGLSDPDHYSTSREMAAFMMFALQNPTFFDVITARSYTTSTGVTITSVNRGPEFMQSYIGGKTGFDEETGWCLIEIAQREDVRLISVTIDAIAPDDWYVDHAILLEYGFNALSDRIAAGGEITGDVVAFAQADQTEATTEAPDAEATSPPDLALAEAPDDGPEPVRIDGTPVPPVIADMDDPSGMFDNWLPGLLLATIVFGVIGLRSRSTRRNTDPAPSHPESQT